MRKIFMCIIGVFLIPLFANAQFWEVGVMLGGSNYSGDLSPGPITLSETHPAIGAILRANMKKTFTLKGNIYYGSISGSDANSDNLQNRLRNLNFRSNLLELGLNAEFNLLGFEAASKAYTTSPYIFVGLSVFKFDPEGYDEATQQWVRLQPLGTEGQGTTRYNERKKYALAQVSIPFGLGLKHNFADNWNLGLEVGLRKTFTDYLDDVSKTYVEYDYLESASGALAARMSNKTAYANNGVRVEYGPTNQRGNSTNKDWYTFAGVTLTYTIMHRMCYEF